MVKFNTCLLGTSFLSLVSGGFTTEGQEIEFLKKIEGTTPRNVIFILSDDHRYDYLGFLGTISWLETPHMDNMFAEGAYFSNAYVTTSLCSPSRATILTGQYSHVHNVVDNYSAVPDNLIWFPQYLQNAGYQTSFIGKWHMGDAEFVERDVESDDPQPGFDHWVSFPGQGVYYDQTLNINGTRISYSDSTYITDQLTDLAIEWLEERDREKPFFLYLSHKAVHADFSPAKRHEGYYAGKNIPLPPTYDQTKTGEWRDLGWPEWVKNNE
jgi:N-acetylglucosamine-6-sulfatase